MKTYGASGMVVNFSEEAMTTLEKYRDGPTEAGGILLGRVFASRILIEISTEPTAADRRGRFFFNRSRKSAQTRVNEAWKSSDGEQIYLGEWHSHPEDVAQPSSRDREMIANNLRDARMQIRFLVLVVIGRRNDWVGIRRPDALVELAEAE